MDRAVFAFLGIDHRVEESTAEIDRWNREWLEHGPATGSGGEKYFPALRDQIAPARKDVRSWADLLDLDKHRDVPERAAA